MDQIFFLGQSQDYIKNWIILKFLPQKTYTSLLFVDGSTQTKEINDAATWENIGVKSSYGNENTTLTYCQLGTNVTEISDDVFQYCSSLSSITIPNSVTSIGACAFQFCSSLTSVNIPSSVTSIGGWAFWYCSSLSSITIPSSVTSIGDSVFAGCRSLSSVTIPNSVTSIGHTPFIYDDQLTSVIFEGRTSAEIAAMANYPWDITNTSAIIPGIQEPQIPTYTTLNFVDGTNKTTIEISGAITWKDIYVKGTSTAVNTTLACCYIGRNVTKVSNATFANCRSLTSVSIPNSVSSMEISAFSYCNSLPSITIPNSISSIGDSVFNGCSSLTSIFIPNSVTSISGYAFAYCRSLPSITIPSSVTSIGSKAFYYCTSLTSVIFEGKTLSEITSMSGYPWSINTSAIKPGIK